MNSLFFFSLALSIVLTITITEASICFPEYLSIFLWTSDDRTQEITYDLRSLCSITDRTYYVPIPGDTTHNWTIRYSFGGNNTKRCNPPWTHYNSGGSFYQEYDGWRQPNDPKNIWFGKYTIDPETGKNVSMDNPCEIIAHSRPDFDLIDPNNPLNGGISLSYTGLPDSVADVFNQCPEDARYGSNLPRSVTVMMYCDPSGSLNDVSPVFWIESSPCTYVFTVKSKAGCGVQGDPIAQQIYANQQAKIQPGTNFGFVVLGGVLCIVFQVLYNYAQHNGYIDMIKLKISGVSSGAVYSKGVGSSSSAPFVKSSGGYGST